MPLNHRNRHVNGFCLYDMRHARPHAFARRAHRYPETDGLPRFRQAVATWYKNRFDVDLDAGKEVVPLIGAKEGIGHMALCFIDPGDVALVPDPGYPVYSIGTMFAGGETHYLPLHEENAWLLRIEDACQGGIQRSSTHVNAQTSRPVEWCGKWAGREPAGFGSVKQQSESLASHKTGMQT